MTRSEVLQFLRAQPWAVEASVDEQCKPEVAVIGVATAEPHDLVFDTLSASRKAAILRWNSGIALVMGWDNRQTAQIESLVDEPSGDELQRRVPVLPCQQPVHRRVQLVLVLVSGGHADFLGQRADDSRSSTVGDEPRLGTTWTCMPT